MLIGVYRSRDPLKSLPKERLYALAEEALLQDVELVFFDTSKVNFLHEYIIGKIYDGETWVTKKVPFPKVMINEWPNVPKQRSENEKRLRKKIHPTTYLIDGKLKIYNMLEESEELRHLVIPSKRVKNVEEVITYIKENKNIVLKPVGGRRGQGIYFVKYYNNSYIVKNHTEEEVHDQISLKYIFQEPLKNQRYIAQPYMHCRTKEGKPYDFRVHVQRNEKAKWEVTKVYPRIGAKKSILSNISRGGRTEDIEGFLKKEFADSANDVLQMLEQTALEVARYINSKYRFMIDELGIDLAIDQNGSLLLYEVNTGPQTRYHEKERAVRTIAYAKYLTNKKTPVEDNGKLTVAMLTGIERGTVLKKACQHAANAHDVNFYFFTPKGINSDNQTIDGFHYVGERRVAKRFNYPDAIYDRLRMKGTKKYYDVYKALEHIPLTNNRVAGSLSKRKMYEKIEKQNRFNEFLIPYQPIKTFEDLDKFIIKHQRVIIKSNHGSYGTDVFQVIFKDNNYLVLKGIKKELLNKKELLAYYKENWEKDYIVQKYIHSYTLKKEPFDIRVHLVKNGKKEWRIAEKYARIGSMESFTSNLALGGYVRKFDDFLIDNIELEQQELLRLKVNSLAYSFAKHFTELFKVRIDEIGLDIGIDDNFDLWLFEVNINRPGTTFHEYEVANLAIAYAKTLAQESQEKR